MSADDARFTIDSNLLVCSVDRDAGSRRRLAIEMLDRSVTRDCRLTLQALGEFYFATTRNGLAPQAEAAAPANDRLAAFRTFPASASAVRNALDHAVAGRAAHRDALLVATAAEAGCTLVMTADFRDGGTLAGVAIHNPFAANGLTERARRLLEAS